MTRKKNKNKSGLDHTTAMPPTAAATKREWVTKMRPLEDALRTLKQDPNASVNLLELPLPCTTNITGPNTTEWKIRVIKYFLNDMHNTRAAEKAMLRRAQANAATLQFISRQNAEADLMLRRVQERNADHAKKRAAVVAKSLQERKRFNFAPLEVELLKVKKHEAEFREKVQALHRQAAVAETQQDTIDPLAKKERDRARLESVRSARSDAESLEKLEAASRQAAAFVLKKRAEAQYDAFESSAKRTRSTSDAQASPSFSAAYPARSAEEAAAMRQLVMEKRGESHQKRLGEWKKLDAAGRAERSRAWKARDTAAAAERLAAKLASFKKPNEKAKPRTFAAPATSNGEAECDGAEEAQHEHGGFSAAALPRSCVGRPGLQHEYAEVNGEDLPSPPAFCTNRLSLPLEPSSAVLIRQNTMPADPERQEKRRLADEFSLAQQMAMQQVGWTWE